MFRATKVLIYRSCVSVVPSSNGPFFLAFEQVNRNFLVFSMLERCKCTILVFRMCLKSIELCSYMQLRWAITNEIGNHMRLHIIPDSSLEKLIVLQICGEEMRKQWKMQEDFHPELLMEVGGICFE